MAFHNPFAFRPVQVTFWVTVVYLALLTPLIYIHETVPRAPAESGLPSGLSLSEAWADLANLTQTFHPYNSHANDVVRDWLLLRTQQILDRNGVSWSTEKQYAASGVSSSTRASKAGADVVVFNDMLSNVTWREAGQDGKQLAIHFQGSNIAVYIRGTSDETEDWWRTEDAKSLRAKPMKKRGVLVNSHFDSVASGYGATDDGVGVVTCLQLIRYFTTPGHRPRRGIVVLFNNAEEDFLLGAYAFGNSPLAPFISTFVNLEGAGAGGRATLFRTTDLEVTRAYRGSPEPFGSVIGTDGFKMRWIRSETDYRVWVENLGFRGVDMAFYTPRALYHSPKDDRRHTSKDSIWHMLSSALTTTINLSGDIGDVVEGGATTGVWFDLFGDSLVLFALRGMFAWSLTILVAAPLILILVLYIVYKCDKDYIFRYSTKTSEDPEVEKIGLGGMKGLFRFPFALAVAGALVIGAALLLRKVQPFIVYSSPYAVWAMMFSLFFFSFWGIMRGANFARPSALHRAYVHIWLFIIAWAVLVAVTVTEDRMQISSGYIFVFWASQVFIATLISFLEFFSLQKKKVFAQGAQEDQDVRDHLHAVPHSDAIIAPTPSEIDGETAVHDDDSVEGEQPTETSPLMGGDTRGNTRTTFATGYRRSIAALVKASTRDPSKDGPRPFGYEQEWSGHLTSWTWILQFLILGPFMIIITGQLGLLLVSSMYQTGADGSDTFRPYLIIAIFSMLLLFPTTPFIHRFTRHLPLFLFLVFVGTLTYNLIAFPFSSTSPYKIYFRQQISVDTGNTTVMFTGHEEYARMIIADLPSARGKSVTCVPASGKNEGLVDCTYDGSNVAPNPGGNVLEGFPPQTGYHKLVSINATRPGLKNKSTLTINGLNTKTCAIRFKRPVSHAFVHNSLGWDSRYESPSDKDTKLTEFTLWRRDWTTPWVVDVEWEEDDEGLLSDGNADSVGSKSNDPEHSELRRGDDGPQSRSVGLDGEVVCRWSDVNTPGVIPALDEAWQFAPSWSIVSIKSKPALVEGTKSFMI